MNFNWKDTVGLTALVVGLVLSGASLKNSNPSSTQNVEPETSKEISEAQPENKKKRQIQSTNQSKSLNSENEPKKASDYSVPELMDCYHNETCPFPNRDPREYKLQVGQAIKRKLNQAYARILKNEETETAYWNQTALKALSIDDGHVKEAALEVISTQDPSKDAFDKILSDIINYHDPLLVAQALAELQKYQGETYQTKVYQTLSQVLQTGSLLVKKEIVQNLVPFVNSKSLPYFQSALEKMNPSSNIHTTLYKIIKDFKSQQTGA